MTSSNGTFSVLLAFVRGILRWPVNSPHRGKWRGALMFPLICVLNKQLSKTIMRLVIWDAIALIMTSLWLINFTWIKPNTNNFEWHNFACQWRQLFALITGTFHLTRYTHLAPHGLAPVKRAALEANLSQHDFQGVPDGDFEVENRLFNTGLGRQHVQDLEIHLAPINDVFICTSNGAINCIIHTAWYKVHRNAVQENIMMHAVLHLLLKQTDNVYTYGTIQVTHSGCCNAKSCRQIGARSWATATPIWL